jgi:hypothetical protein
MPDLQRFLARLYTDDVLRARFLAQPAAVARECGFDDAQAERLAAEIDIESLTLAARSYAKKRALRKR